jgi:hypothetical protein
LSTPKIIRNLFEKSAITQTWFSIVTREFDEIYADLWFYEELPEDYILVDQKAPQKG